MDRVTKAGMTLPLIAFGSLLVAVSRLLIPGHNLSWAGTLEAFAHIWVGVLICLGCVGDFRRQAWTALGLITALEVVAFLMR